MITNVGKDEMFDAQFASTWYIGLIASEAVVSASDTMSSHAGWVEFTDYDGSRPVWDHLDSDNGVITDNTVATIIATDIGTITGIFLCSTSSGSSGTLFAIKLFLEPIEVAIGDTVQLPYTLTGV